MVSFLKIFIASSIGPLPMGGWPISARGRHGRVTCFGHWTVTWTDSPTSEQSFKSHFVVLHHQLFFILTWNSYILDRGCFYLEWKRHGTESNLTPVWTWEIKPCCEPLGFWDLYCHVAQTDGKITDHILVTYFFSSNNI